MAINKYIKRRTLTNIILVFLVLLSMILSFSLWTTGKNIGEEETTQGQANPSKISVMAHSFEEVYRPELIALHGIIDEDPLIISTSFGLNNFLNESMEDSSLTRIKKVKKLEKEEYFEKIQKGKWVEFVYPEELPFGLISSKFTDLTEETGDLFFDRIIFDQYDLSNVCFYHMKSGSFYSTEKLDNEKLKTNLLLDNQENLLLSAEAVFLKDKIKYLPVSSVDIPYQAYIVDQFPKRDYINNFFPDTSLVDVRSTNNYTRYIDLTKEVTINENNHILTYLSQIYTSNEMSPADHYEASFEEINQYENWPDSLILSSYDSKNNILSYRREIEGIPVFSENEYDSLSEISLVDEGLTHMKLPLRFINTPIDMKNSPKKTLLSGVDMLKDLKSKLTDEEYELIQDFSIGYSWLESDEEDQLINFEPNWYIYYKDEWLTYSSLLDLNKETVYGF